MSKIIQKMLIATVLLMLTIAATLSTLHADEKAIKVPVSFSYSSVYWWRGLQANGKGVGVLSPGIALEFGDFSISYAALISENLISSESSVDEDKAKAKTEMDYGISFSRDLEAIILSVGVLYAHYHYYDEFESDATDPSFWEGSLAIGLNSILSPTIEFYYDYYIEAREGSDGDDVPVDEDYYIKLSLSQDLITTKDGFSFTISAWVGYYNNPYFEAEGWSDAVASMVISKEEGDLSFTAGFYYGRTLSRDFRQANSGIKNNLWCDFGITYWLL
jgi:hypothetical protein